STSSNKNHRVVQAIGITLTALVLVFGLVAICYLWKKGKQRSRGFVHRNHDWLINEGLHPLVASSESKLVIEQLFLKESFS
ncbi:hypothetical protein HN51_021822, partial [Arachis hypogaea]